MLGNMKAPREAGACDMGDWDRVLGVVGGRVSGDVSCLGHCSLMPICIEQA